LAAEVGKPPYVLIDPIEEARILELIEAPARGRTGGPGPSRGPTSRLKSGAPTGSGCGPSSGAEHMAETTGITWADSTWNPWRGCLKVSEGCAHCYADTASARNPSVLGVWGPPGVGSRVVGAESYWQQPFKWDRKAAQEGRPWRVFCASFADVFEDWDGPMIDTDGGRLFFDPTRRDQPWASCYEKVRGCRPLGIDDVRARVFQVIEATPHLTWLLLTKRPENVLRMTFDAWCKRVPGHVSQNDGDGRRWQWPKNVWMGTTTENQARADERIPHLLKVPAAVRWLSVEPQLGPVDLEPYLQYPPLHEHYKLTFGLGEWRGVEWVITGGESGKDARPFQVEWARAIRNQCREAGVAFFHKQHGDQAYDGGELIQLGRGGKVPSEWAPDLRVQEFPIPSPLFG
jgi:protein gp37